MAFSFDFPIWAIANAANSGSPILGQQVSKYGQCMTFFTDHDLANAAVEEFGVAGLVPVAVSDAKEFASHLELAKRLGNTHVALDLSAKRPKGWFIPIDELLSQVPKDSG